MSTSDITSENAQAQLTNLFEKLQIQTNNSTGDVDRHFKTLALRHIFSRCPSVRKLPYNQATHACPPKEFANNLADSFLDLWHFILWPQDKLPEKKGRWSNLRYYFELLLQMEAEDELMAKVLGEGKWATTATGEEAGEMMNST